jgi:hypothetical protein
MKIRNQVWIDTEKYLVITLREPFWSAWKTYGWEYGVEGFGVSLEAIKKAQEINKKIRVRLLRYGSYEISPQKALEAGRKFITRDNKPIMVIPRTAFDKFSMSKYRQSLIEEKEKIRIERKSEVDND